MKITYEKELSEEEQHIFDAGRAAGVLELGARAGVLYQETMDAWMAETKKHYNAMGRSGECRAYARIAREARYGWAEG